MNGALGRILAGMLPTCDVIYENTGVIVDNSALQPDILINAHDRAPVIIEGEYAPGSTVENDARTRLGLRTAGDGRVIESVVALRYPQELRTESDLDAATRSAQFSYAVHYGNGDRFPVSGWLEGSCEDIADMVRLISVPQRAVETASNHLETGIEVATGTLNRVAQQRPYVTLEIAKLLGLSDVLQTRRMACAIVANAMIFHNRVAGMHPGVKQVDQVAGPEVENPRDEVLAAWRQILEINYWPIFAIARDIIFQLDAEAAAAILRTLRDTAQRVIASGANIAHDLTGRMFQRLIADRKYLATFYTLPSSAALLARVALSKLEGIDWSDADALSKLRIGDFACGTGALLAAVYEQISTRHENAGGRAEDLHKAMIEDVLYGCDVMPSAIHITGATLSGMFPSVRFDGSRLYTMPYGRQRDGTVSIGSLELLQSSSIMTLFNTSDPALRTGSAGEETSAQVTVEIPDEGFDLVVMNPPFTRATNHEGAHADVTNPAFAAFDATSADQTEMGRRINRFGRGTCYHGNAGISSAFVALANAKLKKGGVLAFVLPLTAAVGSSWTAFREMLAQSYSDISVLSIASNGRDTSFSSDTGIAECLVIARKTSESTPMGTEFTSLVRRPANSAAAAAVAAVMKSQDDIRSVDDGPFGGTRLSVGDEHVGEMIATDRLNDGALWPGVRVSDYSLVQTAHALVDSRLQLPRQTKASALKMARLGDFGKLGFVHRDITGPAPRGPFDKVPPSRTATYPALWNHNARAETRMLCNPDSQLIVRRGMESRASEVWNTASRSHVVLDFRLTSQPLAAALTERESIGGTAWPNVRFCDPRFDYPFVLWSNSTLGLLMYWWHANRQQDGRARTTITAVPDMPTLDLRELSDSQLDAAEQIFEDFREAEFEPAYRAEFDTARKELDRRVICDLLGFDNATLEAVHRVTEKWCAEPSVHGGKVKSQSAIIAG